jgi:hypothetical protein
VRGLSSCRPPPRAAWPRCLHRPVGWFCMKPNPVQLQVVWSLLHVSARLGRTRCRARHYCVPVTDSPAAAPLATSPAELLPAAASPRLAAAGAAATTLPAPQPAAASSLLLGPRSFAASMTAVHLVMRNSNWSGLVRSCPLAAGRPLDALEESQRPACKKQCLGAAAPQDSSLASSKVAAMLRAASKAASTSKAVASRQALLLRPSHLLPAAACSDLLGSSSYRLFSRLPGQTSAEREAAAHAAAQDLAGAAQDSVSGHAAIPHFCHAAPFPRYQYACNADGAQYSHLTALPAVVLGRLHCR